VVSLIDFAKQSVVKGDVGTVIGPCARDDLADKADRVRVDFGAGKGLVNILKTQIQGASLAGGWTKGDKVVSLIDFAKQSVVKGDVGTVIGPCARDDLADKADRVRVDFGAGKGLVNILAKTQIKPAQGVAPKPAEAPPSTPPRAKRWGEGLEAPAAGSRNFTPHGFQVTLEVPEAIAKFGHSPDHVARVTEAGRAKASTASTQIAAMHAAAIFAYTEESPLYSTLNYVMRTPHTTATPTDVDLKQYADYIVHLDRAISNLPAHVSEISGAVYRGIKTVLSPDVYAEGKLITWQAFSSSTRRQMTTLDFVSILPGRMLHGSLFIIDSLTAKDIRHFSSLPGEEEVLFPPNSHFKVLEVVGTEQAKKGLLSQLAAYNMTDLDVYRLRQMA